MSERAEGRRRRAARAERKPGGIAQRPWKQIEYLYQPLQILSADHVEAIHNTALKILSDVGMKVLSTRARTAYAEAGFTVDEASELVKFDPAGQPVGHQVLRFDAAPVRRLLFDDSHELTHIHADHVVDVFGTLHRRLIAELAHHHDHLGTTGLARCT